MREFVPKCDDADDAGSLAGENPETLCANWRQGCNGVTGGPDDTGRLTLCDRCQEAK
jgi:hypothetical protein